MIQTSEVTLVSVGLNDLFKQKVAQGKDEDARNVAECMLEAYREGWTRLYSTTKHGEQTASGLTDGRGTLAMDLLSQIPRYNNFLRTSAFLVTECIRAWVWTTDTEKEKLFADKFVFARLHDLEKLVRKEAVLGLRSGLSDTARPVMLEKVYRILCRLDALQINHNAPTVRTLVEELRFAPAEHYVAIGTIMNAVKVDKTFIETKLPKLVEWLKAECS